MKKSILRDVVVLIAASACMVTATFIFNLYLLPQNQLISSHDALFLEGLLFLLFGILFLLGSGGLNLASLKGALLGSAAEAVFDADTVGPSELYAKDAWRPRGHKRFAVTLMITGVILLLIYFLV